MLGSISVIGEISNIKFHSSGHIYFTMKDDKSRLACFVAKEQADTLRYELADGMEVTVQGYISVYQSGGTYSLNVRNVIVEGIGNLAAAFLILKEKLQKEGLFDIKYKKALPLFPRQIVIVTSETGAAVRDIIKIIKDRNNIIDIIVYPCLVQGPEAAADISRAIMQVNSLFLDADLMIVARGGGSLEDIWPFNEEAVARSIFLSKIPVISAVGHETDFTVSDYVADQRAATPTEAAQIAVPHINELKEQIITLGNCLYSFANAFVNHLELQTISLNMGPIGEQLLYKINKLLLKANGDRDRLLHAMEEKLSRLRLTAESAKAELNSSNPYKIMNNGYAAVLDADDKPANSVSSFRTGDSLTVIFNDGKINCRVERITRSFDDE